MSEPWPPAFIRTAPPTEPGTPTAHSNPVSPAAAVRRASTGSATPPPAVTDRRRASLAGSGHDLELADELGDGDRDAGEAVVGHQQVRPTADDQHRQPGGPPRRRRPSAGRRAARARTSSAAGPPTRYVVSGPSGSSGDASGPRIAAATSTADATSGTASRDELRLPSRRPPLLRRVGPGSPAGAWRCPRSPSRCTRRHARPRRRGTTPCPHVGATTRPAPRVGVEHRIDDQLAGHSGDRHRARRVDLGQHDDVGTDERVGVLPPHLGDSVVPVRLEGDDDPAPPVAAVTRRGDHGGDLGGQMTVVVDERGAAVDAADVETAGHPAEPGKRPCARVERDAQAVRHGDRAGRR